MKRAHEVMAAATKPSDADTTTITNFKSLELTTFGNDARQIGYDMNALEEVTCALRRIHGIPMGHPVAYKMGRAYAQLFFEHKKDHRKALEELIELEDYDFSEFFDSSD